MAETKKIVVNVDTGNSLNDVNNLSDSLKDVNINASKVEGNFKDTTKSINDLGEASKTSSGNMKKLELGLKNSDMAAVDFSGSMYNVIKSLKVGNISGAAIAFKGLTSAVIKNTLALLKSPFGLIAVAVTGLIAVLVKAVKSFTNTTEGAGKVKDIMEKLEPILNIAKRAFQKIGEAVLWVADGFATLVNKIIPAQSELDKTREKADNLNKSIQKLAIGNREYEKALNDSDLAMQRAGDKTLSITERINSLKEGLDGITEATTKFSNVIIEQGDNALKSLADSFYETNKEARESFSTIQFYHNKVREFGEESLTDADKQRLSNDLKINSIDELNSKYDEEINLMLSSTDLTEEGISARDKYWEATDKLQAVQNDLNKKTEDGNKLQREINEETNTTVKVTKRETEALEELVKTRQELLDVPAPELPSMEPLKANLDEQMELVRQSHENIQYMNMSYWEQAKMDTEAYYNAQIEAQKGNNAAVEALEKEKAEVLKEINKRQKEETAMDSLNAASSLASGMADIFDSQIKQGENLTEEEHKQNEKMFNASKGMKIAQVTIDTIMGSFQAITSAISQMGIVPGAIVGGIMAAGITAGGIASVSKIAKTKYDRGGNSSGGAAGAKVNIPAPAIPKQEAVKGVSQQGTEKMDLDTKVYVLESDISNTQSKVKVAESAATF